MDQPITGHVEVTPEGWLHIRLDTLLPNCRYGTAPQIKDAIHTLLDRYDGRLPIYTSAFLVIDEHSGGDSRNVYDPDNKAWKAIPNALKGRVFEDDNQFMLSICLMARRSHEHACHIYVMPPEDAYYYLNWRLR
jgi:hypothetical protein